MAKSLSPEQAKAGILAAIKAGASVDEACKAVSRTRKSYENYRSQDREWAGEIDAWRLRRDQASSAGKDLALYELNFADWRRRFLRKP